MRQHNFIFLVIQKLLRDLGLVLARARNFSSFDDFFAALTFGLCSKLFHNLAFVKGFIDEEGQAAVVGTGAWRNLFVT